MHYRTLIHEYLTHQRPALLAELEASGELGPFLDAKAAYLRERIAYLAGTLEAQRPGSSAAQVQSEALELALADLLPAPEAEEGSPAVPGPFDLDAAIAFVRQPDGDR